VTHSENPGPVTIRDPQVMRAMAHPARLAILDHLAGGHEATATECAEVCGLSPSATSYHLRALAKAGLVEEAPSRGDGRERVWRSAIGGYKVESEDMSTPESLSAALALVDAVLTRDDAHARSFFANATEQPKEWFDAAALTRGRLVMTAAELSELVRAVTELMRPYGRDVRPEPPPGARTVAALFRAIPSPE
jgi:DNA-binding transcriptional ArsR family regulator